MRTRLLLAVAIGTASIAWPIIGQVSPGRDPSQPPPPQVRRIPVGTGVVSGAITDAKTGRPIRGAQVSFSGSTAPPGLSAFLLSAAPLNPGQPAATTASSSPSESAPWLSRTILSDALGQFVFEKVPAGRFRLSVNQGAYLPFAWGQKLLNGPGATIPLTDGQHLTLTVQMSHGGVISGTVYEESGQPLTRAAVQAVRWQNSGGVRRIVARGFATTDDNGAYRITGLAPGDYFVSASVDAYAMRSPMSDQWAIIEQAIASVAPQRPSGPGFPSIITVTIPGSAFGVQPGTQPRGYLPTYYPGTVGRSGASVVKITGNDEQSSIDFPVQLVEAGSVHGSIAERPPLCTAVQVSLLSDSADQDPYSTSSRADGNQQFLMNQVPPGKYTVLAQTVAAPPVVGGRGANGVTTTVTCPNQLDDAQRLWGRTPVTVDSGVTADVSLSLRPARTISGVVYFDMQQPPDLTRGQRILVTLTHAVAEQQLGWAGPSPQAQIEPNGRFTIGGVIAGRYILRAMTGFARSSVINGQDTLDIPLDFTADRDITDGVITVTDKPSEIAGIVTDMSGKPAADCMIVAVSTDQRFWGPDSRRVLVSRPTLDGVYSFRSLPVGDYYLAAVSDLSPGDQYDPDCLKSLIRAAVRVTITEGGKVRRDLQMK